MSKKPVVYSSPTELDGRLPMKLAFPFGLQHVLAMFVGNLSPLLIIMAMCGITVDGGLGTLRVSLLQNAMLVAGINTMIQVRKLGPIGSGLPIVMGTSSGFIGVNKGIAASMMAGVAAGTITTDINAGIFAYGAIIGAQMCGGIFEMVLGFCIKPLRKFFPAVVTGTVVTAIGLSLFSVGIGFFEAGDVVLFPLGSKARGGEYVVVLVVGECFAAVLGVGGGFAQIHRDGFGGFGGCFDCGLCCRRRGGRCGRCGGRLRGRLRGKEIATGQQQATKQREYT